MTLTDSDRGAREKLVDWMKELELRVTIDQMGNILGRREGEQPNLAPVVIGSHIDTQPFGGKLDGAYGVLASLEVVNTIIDRNIAAKRPIEVVSWTNEEGSRFQPAILGSGVFTGKFDLDFAYSRKDRDGKTFGDELERIGFKGVAPCKPKEIHMYIEPHMNKARSWT